MAVTIAQIKTIVRGLIIDSTATGITPAIADSDILVAINVTKDHYFGLRPEAFSIPDAPIATEPPSDYADDTDVIAVNTWAMRQYCFGIASFLLRQRGKDNFYRKAADSMHEIYIGE